MNDATSTRNASATKNHAKALRWWCELQSQSTAYASVVHGSRKNPKNGSTQLLNAWLNTSPKIHSAMIASRGEISASSARTQGMS